MPKRKVGEILKFNLTIPLWIIIGVVALVDVSVYLSFAQFREEIKFISTLIVGASGIYSAYYVGAGSY